MGDRSQKPQGMWFFLVLSKVDCEDHMYEVFFIFFYGEYRTIDSVWLNRSNSLFPILQLFSSDLFSDLFVFSLRNSLEVVLHHTSLHGGVIH